MKLLVMDSREQGLLYVNPLQVVSILVPKEGQPVCVLADNTTLKLDRNLLEQLLTALKEL